jgi:outer membrane lipoprotein SlyB
MSDNNTPNTSNVTVSLPRNALFAAGGVALIGLGIAAGVMFKGRADSKLEAADAASAVVASAPTDAAMASGPGGATAQQASPEAERRETRRRTERHEATSSRREAEPYASTGAGTAPAPVAQPQVVCATCGTVESVRAVQRKGQGSGLGAVAGGVLGGIVGNQMGNGNGKTAMTVLGAIGGGLAGNEIEKTQRTTTAYEVTVRMDDGSTRVVTQSAQAAIGARVEVGSQGLRPLESGGQDLRP